MKGQNLFRKNVDVVKMILKKRCIGTISTANPEFTEQSDIFLATKRAVCTYR